MKERRQPFFGTNLWFVPASFLPPKAAFQIYTILHHGNGGRKPLFSSESVTVQDSAGHLLTGT